MSSHLSLDLGKINIAHVESVLDPETIKDALARHRTLDWGDVCNAAFRVNNYAASVGGRIVSSYRDSKGLTFWVITEHGDTWLKLAPADRQKFAEAAG